MNEHLKVKTTVNLSVNLISKLFTFFLASITTIVLARKLSPGDYGIVGFAMIFIDFLTNFNDLGISSGIIQKERVEDRELYTAFTLKLLLALLLFLTSFLWGNISQRIFDNPAVMAVVVVLSTEFLINSLGFLPTTILSRELKFKRLTVPQISGQLVGTTVAIVAACTGFRYWSIVFSSLASRLAITVIVCMLRPVPLKLQWDAASAKQQLRFGSHIFLSGLMSFMLVNADNFITGSVAGAAVLGFYAVAFNWAAKAPGIITGTVHPVMLSTFSRLQHERESLKSGYLKLLEYVSFASILANVLLLILSKELLTLVLGAGTGKWLPALAALRILCIYGVIRAILEPVASLVIATGRQALMLKSTAIVAAVEILLLYPALRYFELKGIALVVTFSYAVQYLIYFPALRRELGLPYASIFRAVLPAVMAGCVLAVFGVVLDQFVCTSWSSLAIKPVLGCCFYLLTYGFTTRWKILKEVKEIIEGALLRPTQSSPR